MTLTPEKLDEIEQLAEAATPGPWEPNDKRPVGGHGFSLFAGSQYIGHVGDSDGKTPCEANATYIASLDSATVRELVRAARERDHQAARIAELRYRVKRALSGDLYALLTDIQNGIDAPGHKDMANSAIQRIDALLTILEGDKAQPEQPEAGRDELLPCAWCGSPAVSIGMAGIPKPYADREMFTCSNEECTVGEASFSRNQWNRRDHPIDFTRHLRREYGMTPAQVTAVLPVEVPYSTVANWMSKQQ